MSILGHQEDRTLGFALGAETSDRKGFISLSEPKQSRGIGGREDYVSRRTDYLTREARWSSPENDYVLSQEVDYRTKGFIVNQSLGTKKQGLIQDLVARFVVRKDQVAEVLLNGRTIQHRGRNIWHQEPSTEIHLRMLDTLITMRTICVQAPSESRVEIYARDAVDFWIIHFRVFPLTNCGHYWLRWRNRFFTLELPLELSRLVRSLFPSIWARLWYLSEKTGGLHQFQAQGLIPVEAEGRIGLTVEVSSS